MDIIKSFQSHLGLQLVLILCLAISFQSSHLYQITSLKSFNSFIFFFSLLYFLGFYLYYIFFIA